MLRMLHMLRMLCMLSLCTLTNMRLRQPPAWSHCESVTQSL